jgi:hypothetical protein
MRRDGGSAREKPARYAKVEKNGEHDKMVGAFKYILALGVGDF